MAIRKASPCAPESDVRELSSESIGLDPLSVWSSGSGSSSSGREYSERATLPCIPRLLMTLKYSELMNLFKLETFQPHRIIRECCLVVLREDLSPVDSALTDDVDFPLHLDYCQGGTLTYRMKQRRFVTEEEAAQICQKIAQVLHLSHMNGIVHQDLTPDCIYLVATLNDIDIRVVDLGSSTHFGPGHRLSQPPRMSPFMAPEMRRKDYGPKVDLWSLGAIMYYILCGAMPFPESAVPPVSHCVEFGDVKFESQRWRYVTPAAQGFVLELLEKDEKKRLSAIEVLEHPWIGRYCERKAKIDCHFNFSGSSWKISNLRSRIGRSVMVDAIYIPPGSGGYAEKSLFLNGASPFSYIICDPVIDEQLKKHADLILEQTYPPLRRDTELQRL